VCALGHTTHIRTPQNAAHRKPFPAATPPWKLAPRPSGPAVSMKSELLVAREKLGQLLLLTVYVVTV